MVTAIKSVKQYYEPDTELLQLMETFRQIINECIRIGLANDVSTRIKLTKTCYRDLARYNIYSIYKICAISHAAGILANRKTSIRRGYKPRQPYARRPLLAAYTNFKITNGVLKIPVTACGKGRKTDYFDIPLNPYVKSILSDPSLKVRSITLTASNTINICISKEVKEIECNNIEGVDRNLRNLTVGNYDNVVQYDLSKAVSIVENTRSIVRSFKRNDVKKQKKITAKYGKRRKNRVNQLLHHVSKTVVEKAKQDKAAIAFEDIILVRTPLE